MQLQKIICHWLARQSPTHINAIGWAILTQITMKKILFSFFQI